MAKTVKLLVLLEGSSDYMRFLNQFTDKYGFISPNEFVETDILIIPSSNIFCGFEDVVVPSLHLMKNINVDTFGRRFYEETLDKYIQAGTKILALGDSADMLWAKLGGRLIASINPKEEYSSIIGDYSTSPLKGIKPLMGNESTFQCTDYFDAYPFSLVERPSTVFPIAWKADFNRADYKLKITSSNGTLVEELDQIVAFEHTNEKFYGIKSIPYKLQHKHSSEVYKRFRYQLGSPLVTTILKHLLNNAEPPQSVEVPVAVQ